MAPRFPCLVCNRIVGNNHEALQCYGCARWQHSVCGTNFTKEQYLELTRAEYFVWYCNGCAPQFLNLSVPTDTEMDLDVAPASPQPTDTEMDVDIASASPQPSTPPPSPAAAQESSFVVPVEEEEPSLLDEPVQAVVMVPAELTFEVIPRATARGRPLLVDSNGYAYGIHRERRGVTHWRCMRRGKDFKCQAMVRQEGDVFSHGIHEHAHASDTGTATKAKLVRDVKEEALVNPFQSAYTIAECLVTQVDRAPNQRPVDYLGKIGNRRRQQGRPKHPTDLEFDLAMDHVPTEFEMADITVGTRRHLLFLPQHQLDLLKTARRWFVDATFKVVKAPFTQLWSVHTFARVDNKTTQLPLAFALMSGKRRRDYQAVLQALKGELRRLHGEDAFFSLEAALADFEAAVWQAFRQEFPGVELRGCSFHWGQAVFRKELGMQQGFNTDPALHHYCKQLLALPVGDMGDESVKNKKKLNAESESYVQQASVWFGRLMPDSGTSVAEMRQVYEEVTLKFAGELEFEGDVKEFMVPSQSVPGGVPIEMIKPLEVNRRPAVLVYFHDGAMVYGSRKTAANICKILAKEGRCVVINVEYRLAPEAKAPACYDDAKFVLRWVMMNRSLIGAGNDSKVGVGGSGAGGNIAATLAHEISGLAFQLLVYPCVDFQFGQYLTDDCQPIEPRSKQHLTWCRDQFLSSSEEATNARVSPLLQPSFVKLPPALIIVAELDPLKDACYEYKKKMKEAGVEAESLTVKGAVFGFFSQPGHFQETSRRALDKILSFLKKHSTS
ncbi:hypothetical protein ACOMHN_019702 [Nucella lapillus]